MYIQFGFLGHTVTLSLDFDVMPEEEHQPQGIAGGSGGLFERFVEPEAEEEYWEEEGHAAGFGFR